MSSIQLDVECLIAIRNALLSGNPSLIRQTITKCACEYLQKVFATLPPPLYGFFPTCITSLAPPSVIMESSNQQVNSSTTLDQKLQMLESLSNSGADIFQIMNSMNNA